LPSADLFRDVGFQPARPPWDDNEANPLPIGSSPACPSSSNNINVMVERTPVRLSVQTDQLAPTRVRDRTRTAGRGTQGGHQPRTSAEPPVQGCAKGACRFQRPDVSRHRPQGNRTRQQHRGAPGADRPCLDGLRSRPGATSAKTRIGCRGPAALALDGQFQNACIDKVFGRQNKPRRSGQDGFRTSVTGDDFSHAGATTNR